jgi:hypothetical protein
MQMPCGGLEGADDIERRELALADLHGQ